MRATLKFKRAASDPEKAVLPTIIYCRANRANVEAFEWDGAVIALGWWHWALALSVFWRT